MIKLLREKHPQTLGTLTVLARAVGNQGRLEEAEALLIQVLSSQRKALGNEHRDTLRTVHELAYVIDEQGSRSIEAIDLINRHYVGGRKS